MATSRSDGTRYMKAPTWDRSGDKVQEISEQGSRGYRPLVKYGDLFLRFAGLADDDGLDTDPLDSKKNERVALKWAHEYGLLGLTSCNQPGAWGGEPRGGRGDTVEAFASEARIANGVRRLYEAATNPNGVDVDTIAPFVPKRQRDFYTSTSEIAAAWAKEQAAATINQRLGEHSCLQLYCRPTDYRFIEAIDFSSLLGAIYLQAMWLVIADSPLRCRNPKCPRIINFKQPEREPDPNVVNDRGMGYKTYSNKEYCSKKCADAHHYQRVTKPLRAQRARREAAKQRSG